MAEESDHTIHLLFASYPAQGHINPLLQLAKRLAGHRGVRCTLAVTRSVLGNSGGPSQAGSVHVAAFSDGCDRQGYDEVGDVSIFLARLESAGSSTLDELLRSESEQGRPVHAVVYDAFLLFVPRVARRHGAKCAAFFTQACAVIVAYAHAWAGLVKLPVGEENAPPERLPGLPTPLSPADFPSFLTDPASIPAYLHLLLEQCQGLEVADHSLTNSFDELQPEEAEYLASTWGARAVGPCIPSAYLDNRMPDDTSYGFHLHTPMAAESKAWLDDRPARSVVYVSFGSLATPDPALVAEVAEGLYSSGMPFLWVVRASETWKLPQGFVDKVKAEGCGLFVTWSPQLEVLAHPVVGCFVTHCGWNSTIEALGIGVPMVAVPQWSDQPTNAKYVEDVWHVGVRVKGMVTKQELARCVREVMDDGKGYRANAASWSHKAKKAMCEDGSSDNNIAQFLSKLGLST